MKVKLCIQPNCNNFAVEGSAYCEKHFISKQPFKNAVRRSDFYNTYRWKKLRSEMIKENPFCCICGCESSEENPLCLDHINGHTENETEEEFFAGPFQVICRNCHRKKTAAEEIKKL